MEITYIFSPEEQNTKHFERRCRIPAGAIQRTHRHQANLLPLDDFIEQTPHAKACCLKSDILILHCHADRAVLSEIQRWKSHEKTVLLDFYGFLPVSIKARTHLQQVHAGELVASQSSIWIEPETDANLITKLAIKTADAVIVPSRKLAASLRGFTNVLYIPDYLDLERYINVIHSPHDEIVFGWGGQSTESAVFTQSGLFAAIEKVCNLRPDVSVMICGSKAIYDDMPVEESKKKYSPWLSPEKWSSALAQFDIGLAPLDDSCDDTASWLRVLEYMIMKIPWIASQGSVFNELRHYGWLVQNSASAWTRVLLDMIDHIEETRIEVSCEPYFFALGQGIDENIDRILSVYRNVSRHSFGNEA